MFPLVTLEDNVQGIDEINISKKKEFFSVLRM